MGSSNNTQWSLDLTLSEVYGPGHIYAPRAHWQTSQWIVPDAAVLDGITGNQLLVLGNMPVVCSAGVATELWMELSAELRLEASKSIHTYSDAQDAIELAKQFATSGYKVVVQHVYPAGVIKETDFWVSRQVLSYLNNKANIAELVPIANVALRDVLKPEVFFGNGAGRILPIVVKVCTDFSTGGGADVAICRTVEELSIAEQRFRQCELLVVEKLEEFVRNLCVNYAVLPDGTIRSLGFGAQDVDATGHYRGNWFSPDWSLPGEVIELGTAIASRAAKLGYRGILGMDILESRDGRWVVLDLNFRLNGSTTPLLLAPAIWRNLGPCCLHFRGFLWEGGFESVIKAARDAWRSGNFIPLGMLDAKAAGHAGKPSRVWALVMGETQADILRVETELTERGLI
jgi:hypothetical protein